jgi:transposase
MRQKSIQRKIVLSEKEKEDLEGRRKKERDTKIYKRLRAIEMRGEGEKCKGIANLLGVCIVTISNWTSLFLRGGIEAVCKLEYEGRRTSKLEPYMEAMREKVEEDSVMTLLQMKAWLEKEYQIIVDESWLSRFCKKNFIFRTRRHG